MPQPAPPLCLDSPEMSLNPLDPTGARARAALATAAVAVCGGLLAGCGEDRSNLLPGETVKEISANLDRVRELADSGDCPGAVTAAQEVTRQVEGLGPAVDRRLKRSLRDGVTQLVLTVQQSCDTVEGTVTEEEEPVEPETTVTGPTGATGETGETTPEESDEGGATGRQGDQPETGGQGGGDGGQGGNQGGGTTPPANDPGGSEGGIGPGTGGVGPPTG